MKDWRSHLIGQLKAMSITRETRDFFLLHGKLYRRSNEGVLMKCISEEEGVNKAAQVHGSSCGLGGPSLYQRLQRWGIFWPNMKKVCDEMQAVCQRCQEGREEMEVNQVEGWQKSLVDYLEGVSYHCNSRRKKK